jgi:Ni/Co efflux regulator RcnB
MKEKQAFLTLSCLLLLVIVGQSDVARAQESLKMQQDRERHQNNLRSAWDRGGAVMSSESLLRDPTFRDALGVTLHDYRKIQESVRNARGSISDDPEYREAWREKEEADRVVLGLGNTDPMPGTPMINLQALNEEQLKAFNRSRAAGAKIVEMQSEFTLGADQRSTAAFEDALSPEIKQKIQEARLAAMGETSTFSPRLFETLNLTDAQKQQMERIKKELEPEFEKHCEIYAGNAAMILERVNAAIEQKRVAQIPIGDLGAFIRELQEEPEHKKLLDESYASSKALATLFRTRMAEILTDGQRRRLQELIDNPPPYARLLIQRLRRENWGQDEEKVNDQSGENKKVESDRDVWVPGPDSWQPGDPIPEKSRQEEEPKGNFPRPTDSKRESN